MQVIFPNKAAVLSYFVPNFCHNGELSSSLSWLTDSEVFFILFAEISQILHKIYFIPILLTFIYLVAPYQITEL